MPDWKVTAGDVEAASAVLLATANALIGRGQLLWPPQSLTPQGLLRHYPQESWRVAWQGGQAVAAYSLLTTDPLFWPADPPGEARYLHKLGVVPDCQGQGLAHVMLRHAVQETRVAGCPWLKLDTAADRAKLRALYTSFGFEEVGERQVGSFLVTLLRLPVTL
ncbi:GNAT family N-acetyltransferase [Deinococcus fonticola]|uniref:GNAT family N-acetyltransferase n=1 Tax=Deinococcus fonticola TaxID=2528713 RepID=UPI001074D023|nr:GNAT family N-acetyltransferase [Deinococcus fonticola]